MRRACVVGLLAAILAVPVALAAGEPGHSAAANRARARAQAARLLALTQLPPGTVRATSDPTGRQRLLGQPSFDEVTPNLVDRYRWWTTSASSSAVLAYVAGHLPTGAKPFGSGSIGGPPGTVQSASETFALPPVAGVLAERLIGVTAAPLTDGVTAVRTDGEAIWLTPRPSWEHIPPGVRSAVFTASGAAQNGRVGPTSTPRSLTGGRLRRLVGFINRAEVAQPGTRACPAAFAESLTLQFAAPDGARVARAVEEPTGCASVTLTVRGRTGPPLDDYPTVTDELVRLGAVPVCGAGQLSASATPPGRNGAAGARAITFNFQNRSDVMCRLFGFPRLALFDAAGRRIPIRLTDEGAASVRGEGLAADSVLDPDQSAMVIAGYGTCAGARAAVRAQVTLPQVAEPISIAVGGDGTPFAPCHGVVSVGNL